MTWIATAVIGVALLGLGFIAGWVFHRSRTEHGAPGDRLSIVLGVVFTVAALGVAADTVNLQTRFASHVNENMTAETEQLACNAAQNKALIAIADSRRETDLAAQRFDAALLAYLAAEAKAQGPILLPNPAYLNLVNATNDVANHRADMAKVYLDNPFPHC